ncbi:hypothetical protein SAZ11_00270 [Streptomyces sp. FXJ1.4098]|nr:hypothetical protein [Streptomyces sp. FXJ1.4098]
MGQLRQVRDLYARPSADGIADLFTSLIPDNGFPGADQLRQMMTNWQTTMTGGMGPKSGTAPGTGSDNTGDTRATRDPSHKADADSPDPSAEAPADAPAMPRTPDDIRRLIAAWQAVNTTSVDFVNHVGGGDPAALNQQLGRLRDALDGLPDGMADKDALGGLMALLLNVSDGAGGTLQDQALGLAHIRTVTDYLRRKSETSIPMADGLAIMADVMGLITDVRTAAQAEDVKGLRDLLPRPRPWPTPSPRTTTSAS